VPRVSARCPLTVIGFARTARLEAEKTPVQAALNRAEEGTVEVDAAYVAGLEGLVGFDYAWLLTWLGRLGAEPVPLRQVPFLLRPEGRELGVFATRGPRRVNPIGLSLVRLLDVTGGSLRFAGVDLVDGTPIIDIKPYVAAFDRPPGEPRGGWFDTVALREAVTPAELGPPPA
jgi:tRNA (adenine37-N6)-methyltransferase